MGKALEIPILDESFDKVAGAIAQYHIVVMNGATVVISGATPTEAPTGVVQNAPTPTKEAPSVRTIGVTKCVAGAGVTAGQKITSDANGRGIPATSGAGVNIGIVGIARTSVSNDGEIFSLKLEQYILQTAD